MALRYADYGYILENGRVVMDGAAAALRENEDVQEFYLGTGAAGRAQELPRRQELQAPQALALLSENAMALRRRRSPEAARAAAAPAARDQGA